MDEFLKQFGEYAQANGEEWRLDRPELMDAYQAACEEYSRQYKIGPRTFERVFRDNGMVNMHDLQAVMDAVERAFVQILIVKEPKFQFGDRVRKHSGAWWQGVVVGTYTTLQTPTGYCVQLETPTGNGPVQIYPEAALEHAPPAPSVAVKHEDLVKRLLDIGSMCDDQNTARTAYDAVTALSAQVQDVAEVSPVEYMRRHDAAIAAYEANTPNDYRYSALALRKAVDAAFAVAAAPAKQEG